MKSVFSWGAAVALGAVAMLTGCDNHKPQAKPAPGQTRYGAAIEQTKAVECKSRMDGLRGFLETEDEYLPTSAKDFRDGASALKCPGGADYQFLVTGKVRKTRDKVPVLRCPTHNLTLCSDGDVTTGR